MEEQVSPQRRVRRHRSPNRAALLDAAEHLVVTEGYAAVSSRRVAEQAGLKHQFVFYYFKSFDDLLLEVFQRGAERTLSAAGDPFDPERPLQSFWRAARNPISNRWLTEFMALANHNAAIRDELLSYAERLRREQVTLLSRHLPEIAGTGISPVACCVLLSVLSRGLALEDWMGLSLGHAETDALIEAVLVKLDAGRLPPA